VATADYGTREEGDWNHRGTGLLHAVGAVSNRIAYYTCNGPGGQTHYYPAGRSFAAPCWCANAVVTAAAPAGLSGRGRAGVAAADTSIVRSSWCLRHRYRVMPRNLYTDRRRPRSLHWRTKFTHERFSFLNVVFKVRLNQLSIWITRQPRRMIEHTLMGTVGEHW
jgi:hypothetical protein